MRVEKGYMECILVDDTKLEFDKLCTTVREFTSDSYSFIMKNFNTKAELLLAIIPKCQVKYILSHNTEEELEKVKSDSVFEEIK